MLEVASKRMTAANKTLHEVDIKRGKINSRKRKLDTEEVSFKFWSNQTSHLLQRRVVEINTELNAPIQFTCK